MTEPLTALLDHEGTDCKQARFWRYEHDREVIRAHDCRKAFAQVDDELQALRASLDARNDGLRESIDAVADALNAWDQGEPPRPDTHRHWSRIVAALSPTRTGPAKPEYGGALYRFAATPEPAGLTPASAEAGGLDVERLARAITVMWPEASWVIQDIEAIAAEYVRLDPSGEPKP